MDKHDISKKSQNDSPLIKQLSRCLRLHQIPSYIELYILEYAQYCPKCRIFESHITQSCIDCEQPMCKYKDLFCLKNGEKICFDCRKYRANKGICCFYYIQNT